MENIAAWDRGVANTAVTSDSATGVGLEFDTFAHARGNDSAGAWGKMSYRVTQSDPATGCTVRLTSTAGNARFFRDAEWRFRVEAVPEGSRVFCTAAFVLRRRYFFLGPVLRFMKNAIRRDLNQLRARLENLPG